MGDSIPVGDIFVFVGTGRCYLMLIRRCYGGSAVNMLNVLDAISFVGAGMYYPTMAVFLTFFGTGMYFMRYFWSANWKRNVTTMQRWLDSEPSEYEYVNQREDRQITDRCKGGHYHRQP